MSKIRVINQSMAWHYLDADGNGLMPEDMAPVLIAYTDGTRFRRQDVGWYGYGEWHASIRAMAPCENVYAWANLPQTPEPLKEDE